MAVVVGARRGGFSNVGLSNFATVLVVLTLAKATVCLLSLPRAPDVVTNIVYKVYIIIVLPKFVVVRPGGSHMLAFFNECTKAIVDGNFC